jgi:hypothetical protein
MNATSSGMQYVHRKLHRSVTLMRRLLWMRPKVSRSLAVMQIDPWFPGDADA